MAFVVDDVKFTLTPVVVESFDGSVLTAKSEDGQREYKFKPDWSDRAGVEGNAWQHVMLTYKKAEDYILDCIANEKEKAEKALKDIEDKWDCLEDSLPESKKAEPIHIMRKCGITPTKLDVCVDGFFFSVKDYTEKDIDNLIGCGYEVCGDGRDEDGDWFYVKAV